jgi:enoyl-CoA hydratase/carnithine racemase
MSAPELVTYTRNGHLAEIGLNRPAKLNALSTELVSELREAFYRFDADSEAWVAIMWGAGRAFCTGADVSSRIGSAAGRGVGGGVRSSVFLTEYENTKPVICAVQGYAYGAGFRFVLHSDLSVADTTAKFQFTEVVRGLDGSHLWAETALRGFGTFADELAMTGRVCGAEEAHARGLINRLAPAGAHLEVARELADQVLSNPPLAVRALVRGRRARLRMLDAATSAVRHERSLHVSNDFRESINALKARRKPQYTGS